MINFENIKENLKIEKKAIVIFIPNQMPVDWQCIKQEFLVGLHMLLLQYTEEEILKDVNVNETIKDYINKKNDMNNYLFISYDDFFDDSEYLKSYKGHKSIEVEKALKEINKIYGYEED